MRVYSSSSASRERCAGWWCGPRLEERAGLAVLLLQPGRRDHLPDPRVDQPVDLAVEVGRSLESCVGAADVVVVELLAGHAHLLDDILLLDPRAEDVGLVQLDHLLRLVVIDIVDDESVLGHLGHHALIFAQEHARLGQPCLFFLGLAGSESHRVAMDFDLLDVAAVGVNLDGRDDLAPFVIVTVGELIPGRDHPHAHVSEQVLIVVTREPPTKSIASFPSQRLRTSAWTGVILASSSAITASVRSISSASPK